MAENKPGERREPETGLKRKGHKMTNRGPGVDQYGKMVMEC
jgi:hypothetical protein